MCVGTLPACILGACRGQKKTSDLLELELQAVVSKLNVFFF